MVHFMRRLSPVREGGKSARADFAVTGNFIEESATARETKGFLPDVSNRFDQQ
jgi:hypothetical protein